MELPGGGVVVDSHVWVDFFSGKRNAATQEVERLIRAGEVRLVGPVLYELLVGPRQESHCQYLSSRLRALPWLESTEKVWLRAAAMGRLRSVMVRQVPASDVFIAAHCDVYGCALFTRDSHFDAFPELRRHGP
jgi:predicted nucleic acid-binding protein